MQAFVFNASLLFIYGRSVLPFWVIHKVVDLLYVFIYHLFGYRKGVVRRNLAAFFPDKDPKELREIERDFYHCFCDDLVETIKILTLSPDGLRRNRLKLPLEFTTGIVPLVHVYSIYPKIGYHQVPRSPERGRFFTGYR